VTRDEIMMLAVTWDILKHKDKKTGMMKGDLSKAHIDTLLDCVDKIAGEEGIEADDKKVNVNAFVVHVIQGPDILAAAGL